MVAIEAGIAGALPTAAADDEEASLLALSISAPDGTRVIEFAVPDAYCAACISAIEDGLLALPQVRSARVNLSSRRVRVGFAPEPGAVLDLAAAIRRSGYRTHALDPDADGSRDPVLSELARAMAVAGFAAANIMLFSVSVWAGADAPTRNLFHWLSALIALPSIAYAGRPFFRSAFAALRVGRTNMDVPISIGVTLATGLSLYETAVSGAHAYFDASTMLLFFLLVGRSLDHLMRQQARGAIANLARLAPRGATRLDDDGRHAFVALDQIAPGDYLLLRAGERVPVDCLVTDGNGEVDAALVTGESLPQSVGPGSLLTAGAVNLAGSVTVQAIRAAADSFLAQMTAMMEAAENGRTRYRRIADRAAAIYAPTLHLTALLTFLGWGILTGDWHNALINAVAVLIITCPCALALAVPMVQMVAAARLFRSGIMMREGTGLERAAQATSVIFDKTGTLTLGAARLERQLRSDAAVLQLAADLALHSGHPLSQALVRAVARIEPLTGPVREYPGEGIEATLPDGVWRLGSAAFCGSEAAATDPSARVYLAHDGRCVAGFAFSDPLRDDAVAAVAALGRAGLAAEILSGDTPGAVAAVASRLGIERFAAQQTPAQKLARVAGLAHAGEKPMMVGDGINDAPALRAAFVSMAPSSASDIGRSAADFVFTNEQLASVPFTLGIARRAQRLVQENLGIAIVYNALALPLAITGHVTPLIAALAMSGSSILVVANALRLRLGRDLAATPPHADILVAAGPPA